MIEFSSVTFYEWEKNMRAIKKIPDDGAAIGMVKNYNFDGVSSSKSSVKSNIEAEAGNES